MRARHFWQKATVEDDVKPTPRSTGSLLVPHCWKWPEFEAMVEMIPEAVIEPEAGGDPTSCSGGIV